MSALYAKTTSGQTLSVIYWNASDQVYNGSFAWVTWNDANITSYKWTMAEKGTSGTYFPGAAPPADWVHATVVVNATNAIVGTFDRAIEADVTKISGDETAADNLEAAFDGTGGVTIKAALDGSLSGSVGSVTGSVGSVTGSVGSVTGAVGSVTGNVGGSVASVAANGITSSSIATDAINAASLKADAVTKIQTGLSTFDHTSNAVDVGKIDGSAPAAQLQRIFNLSILQGNVTGSPTASVIQTDTALSTSDGVYVGMVLHFVSGSLKGENRVISAYTGATKTFEFTGTGGRPDKPFPSAPGAGDDFVLIGRGSKA